MASTEAAATSFLAPSIQANGAATGAPAVVAMAALGGVQEYSVVKSGWQVSTVMVVEDCPGSGILAAPQQSSAAHVVSPLAGLWVPNDTAFSHLLPRPPAYGAF